MFLQEANDAMMMEVPPKDEGTNSAGLAPAHASTVVDTITGLGPALRNTPDGQVYWSYRRQGCIMIIVASKNVAMAMRVTKHKN